MVDPLQLLAHLAATGTPPDDGDSVLRVSAGLSQSLQRCRQETFPFVASGGGDLQFVFGSYGRGKTHYLKAVSQCARQEGFVTSYVNCQESQSPFKSLVETYRVIADNMTPPGQQGAGSNSGIAEVVEAKYANRPVEQQHALIECLKGNKAIAPEFRNVVRAYLGALGDDADLSEQLKALLTAAPTYPVTLGGLYRKHRGLPKPLGKLGRRNAAAWLRGLLSLPHALGFRGLLVLFDETETVLRSTWRTRQLHLAHIRTFIDHMATGAYRGCAVYYGVAEEFMELANFELEALGQRIMRVETDLPDKRNPRAVWVDLDELTEPSPQDVAFFEELAKRIVALGQDANLSAQSAEDLTTALKRLAAIHASRIDEGSVRSYVKEAAAMVANECRPTTHGGLN